jgi:hypothetical protein
MSLIFRLLLLVIYCLAVNCEKQVSPVVNTEDGDNSTPIVSTNDTGELYFDFQKVLKELADSNTHTHAVNRSNQLTYKAKHLTGALITLTDSLEMSTKLNCSIDSAGKCSASTIKILRGFVYRATVVFSGTTACPWFPNDTLYRINNEYFSALDTVNLVSKKKDTLNLVLVENKNVIYFVSIKNPSGSYTEGKKYSVVETWNQGTKVQALYSGGELKHRLYCKNNDTIAQFLLNDDTGEGIIFSFSFNINSVIDDDIIEGSGGSSDEEGSITINPILFESSTQLKTTRVELKNSGIAAFFNRNGRIYISDSSVFRAISGSDTTPANKSELSETDSNYIFWLPTTSLKTGSYTIQTKNFIDEYGKISIMSSLTIVIP